MLCVLVTKAAPVPVTAVVAAACAFEMLSVKYFLLTASPSAVGSPTLVMRAPPTETVPLPFSAPAYKVTVVGDWLSAAPEEILVILDKFLLSFTTRPFVSELATTSILPGALKKVLPLADFATPSPLMVNVWDNERLIFTSSLPWKLSPAFATVCKSCKVTALLSPDVVVNKPEVDVVGVATFVIFAPLTFTIGATAGTVLPPLSVEAGVPGVNVIVAGVVAVSVVLLLMVLIFVKSLANLIFNVSNPDCVVELADAVVIFVSAPITFNVEAIGRLMLTASVPLKLSPASYTPWS